MREMNMTDKQKKEIKFTTRLFRYLDDSYIDIQSGATDDNDPDTLVTLESGRVIGVELTRDKHENFDELGYTKTNAQIDNGKILSAVKKELSRVGYMGKVTIKFAGGNAKKEKTAHVQDIVDATKGKQQISSLFGHRIKQHDVSGIIVEEEPIVKRALRLDAKSIECAIEKKVNKYSKHPLRREKSDSLYLLLHNDITLGEEFKFLDQPKSFDFVRDEWFDIFDRIFLMTEENEVCELHKRQSR